MKTMLCAALGAAALVGTGGARAEGDTAALAAQPRAPAEIREETEARYLHKQHKAESAGVMRDVRARVTDSRRLRADDAR